MAISPPGWKPDAIPSSNGWRHPHTGELLKSQSISAAEIQEYMGHETSQDRRTFESDKNISSRN